MKIIISHDVDHLYVQDHFFRDLIIPKLWLRSTLYLLQKKIDVRTYLSRLIYIFDKRQNRIKEVAEKDRSNNIPSIFFFGMNNGLGMSYKPQKAIAYMEYLKKRGFDIGVHGVEYQDVKIMRKEYEDFQRLSGVHEFGVRMHYVRYDKDTFSKLESCGYIFDSSEFDKAKVCIKPPYKVGKMWEIPLLIMDGYVIPTGDLDKARVNTMNIINEARRQNLPYCTILFHDYLYNNKCYPIEKKWYDWLIEYLKSENFEFISYCEAIRELEAELPGMRGNGKN